MTTTKHRYFGTPWSITTTPVSNKPGTWGSVLVEIYNEETNTKIGEYTRHYPGYAVETFHPFQVADQWYALYSADYTCTRVAKLTTDSFVDWCGEQPNSYGFCPVEFFVPSYVKFKVTYKTLDSVEKEDILDIFYTDSEEDQAEFLEVSRSPGYIGTHYTNYALVSGCIWGDDSTWKVRYIDLSKIPEQQLVIDERLGYFELPSGLTLKQAIRPDDNYFEIAQRRTYSLTKQEFRDYRFTDKNILELANKHNLTTEQLKEPILAFAKELLGIKHTA